MSRKRRNPAVQERLDREQSQATTRKSVKKAADEKVDHRIRDNLDLHGA